jgi:DNA helicase-2/ATP-dependent DNA helicase PcrA
VLDNAAVPETRAQLARNLAKKHFQNVEPLDCKPLSNAAREIDNSCGLERLKALIGFAGDCMTGTRRAEMEKAIESALGGGRRGYKSFSWILATAKQIHETGSRQAMLEFLDAVAANEESRIYRREMLFAMRTALQIGSGRPNVPLEELVWDVQNNIRHIGRRFARSSVASILLAKGLEFDHSVVVHQAGMTNKDWYVALTRATKTISVVAPQNRLTPAGQSRIKNDPPQMTFNFGQ